jgi:protein-tyrosine phosphatase
MKPMLIIRALFLAGIVCVQPALAGTIDAPTAVRTAPDKVLVRWTDKDPVDVYVADRPEATPATATLVSGKDRDGVHELAVAGPAARPYVLLRDSRSGEVVKVAERVLPLEHGSNFRDIGGYPAADGKHVRWGMIFRSGGQAMLTDADVAEVRQLGLRNLVDLRSDEERVLAPTRLDGVAYSAVGYSMTALMKDAAASGEIRNGGGIYRGFPQMLAPQMRVLFRRLLAHEGPLAFNCSAGQDRTGFATALILSALGVPRDMIVADYHLSTTYRRPEYEMPRIDPAHYPDNAAAQMFARFQADPAAARPEPLKDPDGKAFLAYALEEIDARWGSVDGYLEQEIGLSKVDLAALRATYLE